jgi:hypothetical protein
VARIPLLPTARLSSAETRRPILRGLSGRRSAPLRRFCAALALAALVAGCGSTTAAAPRRAHSDLVSIIEAEGFLHADPPRALATFASMGIDEVRVFLSWTSFAPDPTAKIMPTFSASDPAAYPQADWSTLDEIVRDAAAQGIGLDFTLGGPAPAWAVGPGAPPGSAYDTGWMPSARRFGQFVHAVSERYSGHYVPPGATRPLPRVSFWSIWNEPNYGHYLSPEAIGGVEVAPRLYRGLVNAAWRALLATGHGPRSDTILIGETAPRGLDGPGLPGDFSGMMPLRFVRALYCVNTGLQPLEGQAARARGCPVGSGAGSRFVAENPALFQASGFADHPYPDALAPNVRTTGVLGDSDYADFAALGSLAQTLDRAASAYGQHAALPIYSTEFGYRTNPPTALGLPLRTAALYLNQSEYLSWRNPRIRSYDQYLLSDPPASARTDFDTGIEFGDGRPKPYVYDAYRMPLYLPVTHGHRGSRLEVWGCVRSAPFVAAHTGHPQHVQIQFAPAPTSSYRTVRTLRLTDQHGYFDVLVRFPGSGQVRLQWSGLGHPEHSRTQAISLS